MRNRITHKTKQKSQKNSRMKIKKQKIKRNLKSKKTYYVRIRAYKKSGGAVHVSKWSSVKIVKEK